MYIAAGNEVFFKHSEEETDLRFAFADTATAHKAADMLNKARYLNDTKRKYTAAASLIAEVETLPGYVDASEDDGLIAEQNSIYNADIAASIRRA